MGERHGPGWIAARRFGLKQNSGIRLIDDFSEFGQNDATSSHEKIDVGGVDESAALVKSWLQMSAAEHFEVQLASGTARGGESA